MAAKLTLTSREKAAMTRIKKVIVECGGRLLVEAASKSQYYRCGFYKLRLSTHYPANLKQGDVLVVLTRQPGLYVCSIHGQTPEVFTTAQLKQFIRSFMFFAMCEYEEGTIKKKDVVGEINNKYQKSVGQIGVLNNSLEKRTKELEAAKSKILELERKLEESEKRGLQQQSQLAAELSRTQTAQANLIRDTSQDTIVDGNGNQYQLKDFGKNQILIIQDFITQNRRCKKKGFGE